MEGTVGSQVDIYGSRSEHADVVCLSRGVYQTWSKGIEDVEITQQPYKGYKLCPTKNGGRMLAYGTVCARLLRRIPGGNVDVIKNADNYSQYALVRFLSVFSAKNAGADGYIFQEQWWDDKCPLADRWTKVCPYSMLSKVGMPKIADEAGEL